MIAKGPTFIVFIFLVLTLCIFGVANNFVALKERPLELIDAESKDESIFKSMNYYFIKEGEKSLDLYAKLLKITDEEHFTFTRGVGVLFENKRRIEFESDSGVYRAKKQFLHLESNIFFKDKKSEYRADELDFYKKKGLVYAKGNVKTKNRDLKTQDNLIVFSQYMESDLGKKETLFRGKVKGQIKRKRRYETGLSFKSEQMYLSQLQSLIKLDQDVALSRPNFNVSASRAELFLENYNKRLKYYVLYDDIRLVEKIRLRNGQVQVRKGLAEKMEGFMALEKIILTGAPRVEQGNDVIKGYQITLRENVELVEVDDSQSSFELKKN